MSAKKFHSISSSEEESDVDNSLEIIEEKPRGKFLSSEKYNEILSKIKGMKYDYDQIARRNPQQILYPNDITAEDEIWLMQTPKGINLESLNSFNYNFKEDVSQITLKPRKKERTYNVYTVKSTNEKVNFVLPEKKTRSFSISVHPVAGRIILQEDFQINGKSKEISESIENSSVIMNSSINNSINHSLNSEENTCLSRKKKRKSSK